MYSALFGVGGGGAGVKPRLERHSLRADLPAEGGASVVRPGEGATEVRGLRLEERPLVVSAWGRPVSES